MYATQKATNWMGEEIKGVIHSDNCDTELLQYAFDYFANASHYEYTTTFPAFFRYNGKPSHNTLTTKKFALETVRNYEQGQAFVAFAPKSFGATKRLAGSFGQWRIIY